MPPSTRRALALFLLLFLLLFSGFSPDPLRADPESTDALDEALAQSALTRGDLGWRAKGWWAGYPDVTEKLRHVDDLFAEPLAVVPFARTLGTGCRDLLDPTKTGEKGVRGAGWLLRAAHLLGVERRYGGLRPYSANLTAELTPLDDALLALHRQVGRATRFVTFGQEAPYPLVEAEMRRAAAGLPLEVSRVLGRLVLDLLDAQRWADLAFRNVPMELRAQTLAGMDFGAEEVDALEFTPAMHDLLERWDEASLWYAAFKTVEALDRAREALVPLVASAREGLAFVDVSLETPLGRVRVGGTAPNMHVAMDGFEWLAVDLGGDDTWSGRFAASDAQHALSVALDLSGRDTWSASGQGTGRTQGAGVTGVGVLLDAGGDDFYWAAGRLTQGAGQFGFGALIDLNGDDHYHAATSSQGAGYFGVGLLLDVAGNDDYRLWSDGQGFGGAGGVGTLADRAGNDAYEALVDPLVTGRPSYHTEGKVSVSNAQGCSMGRRGDGADGHAWAGGLGALLDAAGDDTYRAGNWAQGCGYWFGTGLLWDGGGSDAYVANGWAQGSGAHFCVGALVDEAGDDTYLVKQNWGPAYGHDFTVGLLLDVAGNDAYEAGEGGLGWSINRSVALLLDGGGDDRYAFSKAGLLPGTAVHEPRMLDRSGPSRYWTETRSVGALVDAGGTDRYPAGLADGQFKTDAPDSVNQRARNRGVFFDAATTAPLDLDRQGPR